MRSSTTGIPAAITVRPASLRVTSAPPERSAIAEAIRSRRSIASGSTFTFSATFATWPAYTRVSTGASCAELHQVGAAHVAQHPKRPHLPHQSTLPAALPRATVPGVTDRRPALRDVLGLVRLLYLDASEGTDHEHQMALLAIGEGLGAALRAAGPPGTPRHAAALARAVAALERLADMPHPSGVAELVRAGAQRVRGGPREYPVPERELKRLARAARG